MKKKLTSLLLCILLAMGQVQAAAPQQSVEQPLQSLQQAELLEREAELELEQLPLYDRYIVKLKPTNSLAAAANTTLDAAVEAAIPAAKQAANVQVQAVLDDKQVDETEAFDLAETPAYTVDEQSAELLTVTLTEKVDAAAFTAELADNAQIEYIQPDYTLELASEVVLDLDLSELTPAGAPVPAVTAAPEATSTPEIDIEITPETTQRPEAAVEPEETPGPAPDVTAEPTPEATPAAAPIVAVIDAGVDVAHHGLTAQMLPGYDFVNNTELVYDSSKKDEYYHGTHVAGVIAQNAPTAQILPLKVFEYGRAYTSDILRAIEYAQEHGASIVNMSFGGADDNRALKEAMAASDMLFVCAAGNARTDVEEAPVYPACFDLDNIISVASLNQDLGFSYYSNYGTESVDIAAVGRDVYSMWPEGEYGEMSGTSQAAAQVSAGAAEALARGDADAKAAVLARADRYTHLMNKVAEGRSLNLFNVAAGVVNDTVQTVAYEDDFDVHGYAPTPEENWELFSSLENVQVAAGNGFTAVLKSDGTIWTWGDNQYGQLGDGTNEISAVPKHVVGLTDIIQISAKGEYVLALKSDGTVWGWGKNTSGQLGNGTTTDSNTPVKMLNMSNAYKIEAGRLHGAIIKNDGTLWSIGFGDVRLGNGGESSSTVPVQVMNLTNVIEVSCGFNQTLAVQEDGTLWAWGDNYNGQFGNGTTESSLVPVKIENVNGVKKVAAGYPNSTILLNDGTLMQTHGSSDPIFRVLEIINGLEDLVNNDYNYAAIKDGQLYVWGLNQVGILGVGTTENVSSITLNTNLPDINQVSIGLQHSAAIDSNGKLWTWGDNQYGQLGDGKNLYQTNPTECTILGNTSCIAVGAGSTNSLAIKNDGTTLTWGSGIWQDSTLKNSSETPIQIDNLTGIDYMVVSDNRALGIKNGTVWGFGTHDEFYGQLGDNSNTSTINGMRINSLENIVKVDTHSVASGALDESGNVYVWGGYYMGENSDKELISHEPVQLNFSNIVDFSLNAENIVALKEDGTVWGWGVGFTEFGENNPIQLPGVNQVSAICRGLALKEDGTVWQLENNTYQQIDGLNNIIKISARDTGKLALKDDGTVWSWGSNFYGQLGNGTRIDNHTPAQIQGLSNITAIYAGNSCFAIDSQGRTYAWGNNRYGQLGDGTMALRATPYCLTNEINEPLPEISVATIAAGSGHSLIIGENGTILASGRGSHGQLGNGARQNSTTPVQVKDTAGTGSFTGAKAVAAGFLYSLALKEDGTLWTWGNATGFLTDTGDSHSDVPVPVIDENGEPLANIISISAKKEHWLALRADGTVWSWGRGANGQLGNGATEDVFTHAVQVKNADGTPLVDVIAISAGGSHSMAKKADGTIWAWGKNENGQLGNGASADSSVPVQVMGLAGIEQISAGEYHSMALRADGTVWAWGRNQYGQLGDNTRNSSSTPVQVTGENGFGYLTGVEEIAAGIGYSMALMSDGTLMAWGHNNSYQLGDGTQQSRNAPVQVLDSAGTAALADVVEFSANGETTMAKTADGTVWIWGTNRYGEFGDGTNGSYSALPLEFGFEVEAFYASTNEMFSIETGKI
ncbi:MAG TPA: S8 family serine peptidase, partial [Candidatus Aphodoplasma excrementigallinarum]|nr:S8 family serine peptidase [Candidatus Aphodoplasma excrementigallinarum]